MNLILGKRVFVKVIDTDGYGRTVGLVYFGKDFRRDASFEVISAGWAWAYWQYLHKLPFGYKKRYAAAHYSAKNAKIGLWRDSEVLEPWNYRRQNKSLLKRFSVGWRGFYSGSRSRSKGRRVSVEEDKARLGPGFGESKQFL